MSEPTVRDLTKKQFLTKPQLDELWDLRGMKFAIDEIFQFLVDRGLTSNIRYEKFRSMIYKKFSNFAVDGLVLEDPRRRPRQKFPKVF